MKDPRFLTFDEEVALALRPREPDPDLDALIPFPTIPISKGCFEISESIGPLAEGVLGFAYESYSEGLGLAGDPIIRDIYLPIQEIISPTFFDVTPNMVAECTAYLRQKRKQTGLDWVINSSLHGHGKAKVIGETKLTFSRDDITKHMAHFLQTQSLHTRRILEQATDLSLMFNNINIETVGGNLQISDGFAYHPVLTIMGLKAEQQEQLLREQGIDPRALNNSSALDLVAAYLRRAAEVAEQQQRYAISAKQWRVLRYNYFVVFDNYKNYHAEIGILVEDTVSGRIRTHRKEVPLEPVKVKKDIRFRKRRLVDRIRAAYAPILERQQSSVQVSVTIPAVEDPQALLATSAYPILLDKKLQKEDVRELRADEIASMFFHSALQYLDLARSPKHKYSGFLSELVKMYCLGEHSDHPLSLVLKTMIPAGVTNAPKDIDLFYVNLHFDHLKPLFVANMVKGLESSPALDTELTFMRDFAYAPSVADKNRIIGKYVPLLVGIGREQYGGNG